MEPEFLTRFVWNDSVIVELSSDYSDSVMVEVKDRRDPKGEGRTFMLEPDEIELFIVALNLYKKRILQRRPNEKPAE